MSDYSRIVAPFDGVVTWRYADTGALVQAGTSSSSAQPVVKLAQVNVLRLRVPVPESIAGRVHNGTAVEVSVQATGEHFTGTVARATHALDPSTRTEQVEIDVANRDMRLSPGMFANVVLQVEKRSDAVLAPLPALVRSGSGTEVQVVNASNRVETRQVRTGMEDASYAEVLSGLKPGESVVVANPGAFRDGELVAPRTSTVRLAANEGGQQ
jgi:RND family efflux transporter MFP subunit